jgi:ABC-2 type transport system permease protein
MSVPQFFTLVRRELWEYRSLLWVPLAAAVLMWGAAIVSSTLSGGLQIQVDGDDVRFFEQLSTDSLRQSQLFAVWISALLVPLLMIGFIVIFFYLTDSLYAERKDRSILFWKSMPVSDLSTVGSKAFTALVAVPLWIWSLSLLLGLGIFAIIAARYSGTTLDPLTHFHLGVWFTVQGTLLLNILIAVLWYAPIAAYLLTVSVLVNRAPVLWVGLIPMALAFAENAISDTTHILQFIGHRLAGFFEIFAPSLNRPDDDSVDRTMQTIELAYRELSAASLLADPQLWLGVVVAMGLGWAAARLRRWRDDG